MFHGRRPGIESSGLADLYIDEPRRNVRGRADDPRDGGGSGSCATCGSKMRWPSSATEFRCSVCLMINDLQKPSKAHNTPISIDRTRFIVERCVDEYLKTRQSSDINPTVQIEHGPPHSSPPASPNRSLPSQRHVAPQLGLPAHRSRSPLGEGLVTPPLEDRGRSAAVNASPSHLAPVDQVRASGARKTSFSHGISRKPLPPGSEPIVLPSAPSPQTPRQHAYQSRNEDSSQHFIPATRIFKPLENFLARHLGDQETLNGSFFGSSSKLRREPRSELQPEPRHKGNTQGLSEAPRAAPSAEPGVQELDAKTLLLGDFAENGMWWTGQTDRHASSAKSTPSQPGNRTRHESKPENSETKVSSRSPLISWSEVEEWFDLIVCSGVLWRERARQLGYDKLLNDQSVESAFIEGREHLHRAVLKISESLLKRPGQQLKESQDTRFLLILLANPLLYPESTGPRSFGQLRGDHRAGEDTGPSPGHSKQPVHSAWDQGNAFGIIKRIFGILSNMPPETHRHLTSWFSRYDELRFRSYVDLVQRFLTHRLKRQHGRKRSHHIDPVDSLIPTMSGTNADTSAQLHAALGFSNSLKTADTQNSYSSYSDDWQVKAAAKIMAMLFSANKVFQGLRSASTVAEDAQMTKRGSISRTHIKNHGQLLSTTEFYNSMVDVSDPIADFDVWEQTKTKFSFCQYPFLLSVGSKIKLIQHDAARQMKDKAREAFFNSVLKNKAIEQFLSLKVRRGCLVEDSLNGISEVVASTSEDLKKGLKVQFVGEEGIDAGGIRKEWFLLLIREIFNPQHGLFLYDDESPFCYFNPHSFETTDRFYLVGAVLGLAIYNSIILDVALPPFLFKKLLSPAAVHTYGRSGGSKSQMTYTLKDLAEYKPTLARGLRQLLEYDGNVQETFQRDFVIEVEKYGTLVEVPLCDGGAARPVTNANRTEFVDLYIKYLLDTQVARQFEPFKRGFATVAGGNALSLFQPEEIELLVRGSDEPLDVPALRAVAEYENWRDPSGRLLPRPAEQVPLLRWFWELFEAAAPGDQRLLLAFVTGSDRIPAVGAASLVIRVAFGGSDRSRLPIARTCFNLLLLYGYSSKQEMAHKLWMAVLGSEGFGLK